MVVWALEACFASSCCILQECSRFAFEHSHSSQCWCWVHLSPWGKFGEKGGALQSTLYGDGWKTFVNKHFWVETCGWDDMMMVAPVNSSWCGWSSLYHLWIFQWKGHCLSPPKQHWIRGTLKMLSLMGLRYDGCLELAWNECFLKYCSLNLILSLCVDIEKGTDSFFCFSDIFQLCN